MPGGTSVPVLRGNAEEARIGVRKLFKGPDMHVDIGNSIDMLRIPTGNNANLTVGVSFFAYAYVTSVRDRRLQVDAIDGFFGGYMLYSSQLFGIPWLLRTRILHHSAHMADGRYDKNTQWWVDGKLPRAYSRDHVEISSIHDLSSTRIALGASAAWFKRPSGGSPFFFLVNAEQLFYSAYNGKVHLFGAYNLRMESLNGFQAAHTINTGIKFGNWTGRGMDIYMEYFSGLNFFAEYYDETLRYLSVGFNIYF